MVMRIDVLMSPYGENVSYTEEFRVVLDSYISVLKTTGTVITVSDIDSYKYDGDFYGYLDNAGVPKEYHYAYLIANSYKSPFEFNSFTQSIIAPDPGTIDLIKQIFKTRKYKL
jgi:hypothetical protein